ncbi:MAG: stage 0 sporulation family protein [Chloroflexi bacterium]|nr:stage 0 sporulation family protein [Chloroflexota bacterium]
MPEIVGVRFRRAGRIYYFDPAGLPLGVQEQVVVETARGLEIGQVVIAPRQVVESDLKEPLKPVLRQATEEDLGNQAEIQVREVEARSRCRELAAQLGLPMKILDAQYNLDGSRLIFQFSSEGRVDFRELLRQLGATFHTRVELRQLGARDESKLLGGLGPCGRPLCCSSFLNEFCPVSIRMAKDQDLPLNPAKISGLCGRLMCCLTYEHALYAGLKRDLPRPGQRVGTPMGPGLVVGGNALKRTAVVRLQSEAEVEFPLAQLEQAVPLAEVAPLPGDNELVPGGGPGGKRDEGQPGRLGGTGLPQ